MEENNRRVLAPWRQLYPVTAWQYSRKVKQVRWGAVQGIVAAWKADELFSRTPSNHVGFRPQWL